MNAVLWTVSSVTLRTSTMASSSTIKNAPSAGLTGCRRTLILTTRKQGVRGAGNERIMETNTPQGSQDQAEKQAGRGLSNKGWEAHTANLEKPTRQIANKNGRADIQRGGRGYAEDTDMAGF